MDSAKIVEVGQVWTVIKDGRTFKVVEVIADRQSARVVSCLPGGTPIDGRKPYHVTLRTFGRRYELRSTPCAKA